MKIKALIIALTLLCSLSVLAQTNTQPQSQKESNYVDFSGFKGKIFELKNRDPRDLVQILSPLGSGFKGATIQANFEMKTLTVRDFPENLAVIEEAIKRLDTPKPPNKRDPDVEVHLHALLASNVESSDTSSVVPPELKDVIKQLQTTLNFKNYSLLTSIIQRGYAPSGLSGRGVVTVGAPLFEKKQDANYDFQIGQILGQYEGSLPNLYLNGFKFDISGQTAEFGSARIGNNLQIREGEKLVVGTASLRDKALILVLTVKVIR